jgi:hypothetical protein
MLRLGMRNHWLFLNDIKKMCERYQNQLCIVYEEAQPMAQFFPSYSSSIDTVVPNTCDHTYYHVKTTKEA